MSRVGVGKLSYANKRTSFLIVLIPLLASLLLYKYTMLHVNNWVEGDSLPISFMRVTAQCQSVIQMGTSLASAQSVQSRYVEVIPNILLYWLIARCKRVCIVFLYTFVLLYTCGVQNYLSCNTLRVTKLLSGLGIFWNYFSQSYDNGFESCNIFTVYHFVVGFAFFQECRQRTYLM